MQVATRHVGDVTIVDLEGRLAAGGGDSVLRRVLGELVAAGRRRVLVNLERVTTLDSSGIGELVAGWKRLRREGGQLAILRPGDRARHTLHLSQLLPLLAVFETEEDALQALAG
jgi:Anti-anti-sigma regulatory factor (antagonist of anti-sigma factor)